jgi:prepilin-type N-terminal cleavage/methylation domain-containing protein
MARPVSIRGLSLSELLVVVAIVGMMAGGSAVAFRNIALGNATRAAAREIGTELRKTRSIAIARGHNVAIRFREEDGVWLYALFEDGDFDGVRNDDIKAGIDREIQPERPLLKIGKLATIGIPPIPLRDPDTGKLIPADSRPVRFGNSMLCSFSPRGSGTPGSVFVTDRYERVVLVRVTGSTGRVRSLIWDPASGKWRQR